MRSKTAISLLLAGLLGAATAWAETPPTATTDVSVGGQASTMTQGRPNMATTDQSAVENPSAVGSTGALAPVPQDHMRRSRYRSDPRLGTGEMSTMVNGRPNANPYDPLLTRSREEWRAERELKHADARTRREQATMGQRGAPEPWQQPGGKPE